MRKKERLERTIAELRESLEKATAELKEEDVGIVSFQTIVFKPGGYIFHPDELVISSTAHFWGFRSDRNAHVSLSRDPHVALPGRLVASGEFGDDFHKTIDGLFAYDFLDAANQPDRRVDAVC